MPHHRVLKMAWKGKEKAVDAPVDDDFSDLDPVITYRHLLSQNLGIRDPLRIIALCDSDGLLRGMRDGILFLGNTNSVLLTKDTGPSWNN